MEEEKVVRQFLQDAEGHYSSTRLAFLLFAFVTAGVWSYLSIKNSAVQDIPAGLASVIFTFMAGKVGQTWLERK